MSRRDHKPVRSLLLAGDEYGSTFDSAIASGADALFLDLEDPYVPCVDAFLDQQRAEMREFIEALPATGAPRPFVRVHKFDTGRTLGDLRAVMVPGLAGVILPHVGSPADVIGLDAILECMERDLGLSVGSTLIIPILEVASGLSSARQIAEASERVNYMGPHLGPLGDTPNSLKYRMTASGDVVAPLMSHVLIEVRAGGVPYPLGMCLTLDYARSEADMRAGMNRLRDWGYCGTMVWDADHVAMAHEIFSPSAEDIERWSRIIELYDAALQAGEPVRLPGYLTMGGAPEGAADSGLVRPHIITTARQGLEYARALGLVDDRR